MSSSRSIAAARNRRAGEAQSAPSSRPGTSINAQPAFSQQQRQRQPQQQQQQQQQQPRYQQQQQQQQQQQAPAPPQNVKLSVSDAIGLITLRLGRVEQILIDQQHEAETTGSSGGGFKIPEGTQLFDKSVMNSIINRLDALEKRDKEKSFSQDIESIKNDFASKLIVFNEKMDNHVADTERRFVDIENAFVDLENSVAAPAQAEEHQNITLEQEEEEEEDSDSQQPASVFSLDLKNIVNEELKKI